MDVFSLLRETFLAQACKVWKLLAKVIDFTSFPFYGIYRKQLFKATSLTEAGTTKIIIM